MESTTQLQTGLFGDELPSLEHINKLSHQVHTSERNTLAFQEEVEANLSSTSQKTLLSVGIGLCILGRYEEAIEKLSKAKDCKEKFIFLANALRRRRRFDEAIESLQKSLANGAEALSIALEKAVTYREADDFDAAAKELKSVGNFQNVSAEYHYQLGRLKEDMGLYSEAVDNYSITLELAPKHYEAIFRLAYRCDLSGDEDAAIGYYRQISEASSAYINALLNLAVLYEDRGEFHKAANCVDMVLESHPNHQRAGLFKKDIDSSKTMFYDEEKEKKRTRKNQILETPISDFELSVRSRNCLKKMKIDTLGDLLKISETELLSYKNFGETSLKEIKAILEMKGLELGQALDDIQFSQIETLPAGEPVDENEGLLNKPVIDLQLSVRARKCIQKLDIRAIGDLTRKTEAELLGCKNFGVTSLNEIKKALTNLGLSLRSLD
jgi:DNA-directed RNA polymerase subunit alpha